MSRFQTGRVLCCALLAFAAVSSAAEMSVVYGKPQYTDSIDDVKTVYYTPNLCNKDTAASLPASDKLILALNLSGQATVLGFQVSIVDQLNTDQQEQVVVRVGDVRPELGPSENPLCRIASVNSSSLMTKFDCLEPLNGTYITITKNDGGPMDICGFSATLAPNSDVEGPTFTAEPVTVLQDASDEESILAANKVFVAESPETDTPAPAPGGLAPFLPTLLSSAGTGSGFREGSSAGDEDDDDDDLAPGPATAPSPSTSTVDGRIGDVIVFPADNSRAETPMVEESLTGLPSVADIGTPEVGPQILVVPVIVVNVPVPAPALVPAPAEDIAESTQLLGEEAAPEEAETPEESPASAPALAPEPSSEVTEVLEVPPAEIAVAEAPVNLNRANLISVPQEEQPSSSSSQSESSNQGGLSRGDKAGIAVGVVAGVALLAAASYFIYQRRR